MCAGMESWGFWLSLWGKSVICNLGPAVWLVRRAARSASPFLSHTLEGGYFLSLKAFFSAELVSLWNLSNPFCSISQDSSVQRFLQVLPACFISLRIH